MIFQVDQIILLSSERSIVELDTYIWISIEQWGYRSRLYLVQWAVFTVSYLRVSELQEHSRAQDPEYIESLTTLHQCYFFFHNTNRDDEKVQMFIWFSQDVREEDTISGWFLWQPRQPDGGRGKHPTLESGF